MSKEIVVLVSGSTKKDCPVLWGQRSVRVPAVDLLAPRDPETGCPQFGAVEYHDTGRRDSYGRRIFS